MAKEIDKKELARALRLLISWADMRTWDVKLAFMPMDGKYGEAHIQSEYRQATIRLNSNKPGHGMEYRHDSHIMTLCHEFVHIWLWDMHNPETYDTNWAYNRLVEGHVEMLGRLLYKRVLQPEGF